jgi:hypothetical protein
VGRRPEDEGHAQNEVDRPPRKGSVDEADKGLDKDEKEESRNGEY